MSTATTTAADEDADADATFEMNKVHFDNEYSHVSEEESSKDTINKYNDNDDNNYNYTDEKEEEINSKIAQL